MNVVVIRQPCYDLQAVKSKVETDATLGQLAQIAKGRSILSIPWPPQVVTVSLVVGSLPKYNSFYLIVLLE